MRYFTDGATTVCTETERTARLRLARGWRETTHHVFMANWNTRDMDDCRRLRIEAEQAWQRERERAQAAAQWMRYAGV